MATRDQLFIEIMSRYYIKQDDQFEYEEGFELYHLFDRQALNQWGEHACLLPFGRYRECSNYKRELEAKDASQCENSSVPSTVDYE